MTAVTAPSVTPSKYETITQLAAGPIAIIAGWLATQITQHFDLFGSLDLGQGRTGQSQLAHAIVAGLTFVAAAGVTYLGHHKVLDNIQKRWESKNVQSIAGELAPYTKGLLVSGPTGETEPDPDAVLAEIDQVDAALTKLLAHPGTPPEQIAPGAGLAATSAVPA